ncbi:hypothetical protein TNCV_1396381 [Trichonephila clavipes]|nr:hypothetical protein TNCV_1396381 [Trichonephila clavipes]
MRTEPALSTLNCKVNISFIAAIFICFVKELHNLSHLRFDIFELEETKLPVRLINTTDEQRLLEGHETPLKVKGDIDDVSSELDNGG